MRRVNYQMKRREKKPPSGGSPGWMTTYGDLVTLLLCFFVLLYSMSQIDIARFEAVAESFRNRSIFYDGSSAIDFEQTTDSATIRDQGEYDDMMKGEGVFSDTLRQNETSLEELLREVESFLEENGLEETISANLSDEGVEIGRAHV